MTFHAENCSYTKKNKKKEIKELLTDVRMYIKLIINAQPWLQNY